MKQKTKKLLQLSFSLGFLATTALVATSCNQPKTVTPKPTNPMQPGNGSGSETTTPGTGETMQPGSGSGTGTTTPDNNEAKNQLKALINEKDAKLAAYNDYSTIKTTLSKAYEVAKMVSDKTDATKDELVNAKTNLGAAIAKAAADKKTFDDQNSNLVTAYIALKDKLSSKDSELAKIEGDTYQPIKTHLDNLYNQASNIISATLQAAEKPKTEDINQLKTNIDTVISKLDEEKANLDKYSSFEMFKISEGTFSGDFKYTNKPAETQKLVGFSSDFDNNQNSTKWQYANRIINGLSKEDSSKITSVGWIYSLSTADGEQKTTASYDITFTYYGGDTATLYFPYKATKADQVSNMLSLKYKLNNTQEWKTINVADAKVDSIEIATVNLSGLNFGENKISFSTDKDKIAPMIGNIYISINETSKNDVYNNIFGNEKDEQNPNKVTVNFAKGYSLASKAYGVTEATILTKLNGKLDSDDAMSNDYYLIGYLGNRPPYTDNNESNIRYYTFYVNVPKDGMYEINGIYNSGDQDRGLSFSKDRLNNNESNSKAVFRTPKHGEWNQNKLKTFNAQNNNVDNQPTKLQLTKGLNKIIVSGQTNDKYAPNLGM
ncbi:Vmc-like lipoprotein signal peptide domain-containing protein [Mycoplasma bradburyae]|uniref:Vmc-like lipoprotein signal peptide domain-containing protein n=1 Tax=Mycoplasma bradburyae TaxID=2963128 RepID=UPI00234267F5|nr:hypothetical protein [Mycoplasma bradburyae]MDC4183939.1 hypothetical protein [Mycoplasma bradburyae]